MSQEKRIIMAKASEPLLEVALWPGAIHIHCFPVYWEGCVLVYLEGMYTECAGHGDRVEA